MGNNFMNHKEIMNDMLNHPELIEKYLAYMSVVCNTLVQDSEMYNFPISELLEDFAQISQAVAIQEKNTGDIGRINNDNFEQ